MSKTIQSRIQHPVYTAAVLKAKNPVLLKGEVSMNRTHANTKSEMAPPHGTPSRMPEGGDFEGPISASNVTQDANHRFVTDTEKTTWNGKASTTVATQSANGLMSAADKKKLDGVATGANNYQHPATHPASVIVQDSTHRFVTDTEKSSWNNKAARDVATQISKGLMSALDKEKLDCISAQCLISTSTTTVSGTLDLSSNVSYTKGKGYISSIRLLAQSATSLTIDSTVLATDDLPLIVELVLRCRAGLASNLNLSILLAGDASNSSITIPKGSKLITLSFMMLNGHTDKYSCYRVSVI